MTLSQLSSTHSYAVEQHLKKGQENTVSPQRDSGMEDQSREDRGSQIPRGEKKVTFGFALAVRYLCGKS